MGQWRTKVLHSLILFSTGFATAVYVLAPPPAEEADETPTVAGSEQRPAHIEYPGHAQDRAVQMRAGMDKAMSFAEEYAVKAFRAAKLQLDNWRQQRGR
jgi:hypothetical protein